MKVGHLASREPPVASRNLHQSLFLFPASSIQFEHKDCHASPVTWFRLAMTRKGCSNAGNYWVVIQNL